MIRKTLHTELVEGYNRIYNTNHPNFKSMLSEIYVKNDKTIQESADILGVGKDFVWRRLRFYKIPIRSQGTRQTKWEKFKNTKKTYIQTKTLNDLSNEFGLHKSTIIRYLRKQKIKLNGGISRRKRGIKDAFYKIHGNTLNSMKTSEIALLLGCSNSYVNDLMRIRRKKNGNV